MPVPASRETDVWCLLWTDVKSAAFVLQYNTLQLAEFGMGLMLGCKLQQLADHNCVLLCDMAVLSARLKGSHCHLLQLLQQQIFLRCELRDV